MQSIEPYFREVGAGPGVVCVHANASSSSQWRTLMERLAPRFRVLAADSYGAGKSPPWPKDRTIMLDDEIGLLEPVFARAGDSFALVGHSYGAAVALLAALRLPQRIRDLVLYEPTLFALLDAAVPPPNDADGIRQTAALAATELAAGGRNAAAERFIDYWMGAGTWARMPESRCAPIEASIVNIQGWATALLGEPTPLSAFRSLEVPVLLLTGKNSPASSLGVARLLAQALPNVRVIELDGLGHMGPITHPEIVNAAIETFLVSRWENRA